MEHSTIAAIATAPGAGGIAVVRLSGPESYAVAAKVFCPANPDKRVEDAKGYTALFGHFMEGEEAFDEGVALFFRAPHSYTGEDVVELSCHGGSAVARRLVESCIAAGAAPAAPGEYTRRAFLNGKLGLTQAEAVMDLIRAIRARRAEMNVPPSKKAELMIVTDQAGPYQQGLHFIQRLAYASNVTFPETAPADVTGLVSVVTHDATAYLPLSELVDLAAERERIAKELEKAKNGLRITEGKLANEKFVAHAPENVVNAEREKVAKYQELIAKLEESAKAMA